MVEKKNKILKKVKERIKMKNKILKKVKEVMGLIIRYPCHRKARKGPTEREKGRDLIPIRQPGASNLPDQRRRGVVEKEGVRSSSYGTGFALLAEI